MSPTELQDRIQKLFDEDLSAEEFGELEAELLENPEALKTYCVWVDLHCRLQKNGSFQSAVALTLIDDRSVLPITAVRSSAFPPKREKVSRWLLHING